MNENENENKVTERNVQAEHSNASANNAMVDDSAAAAASNELDALRVALQRTQQALARAEHEVEQLRTQAADTKTDTIAAAATTTTTTTDSNKDADTIINGLESHDSNIDGTGTDARAETAALNEQLAAAREALALQRKPQPQLLVLADSSTLNAFTTDKISAASITAVETELANATNNANTNAQAAEAGALLLSSAAARTRVAEAATQRARDAELE